MREKILDGAGRVFSRRGFHMSSMDEIALEAGVAKGTLYYYFKSKSELFKTVVIEGINFLIRELKNLAKDFNKPIKETIKFMIKKNIDFYLDYYELANVVLNEITVGIDEDVLDEIKNAKEKYSNFLAKLLSDSYEQGIVRYSNFDMQAAGVIGMINGICKYYLDNPNSLDRNKITEYSCIMIMNGLLSQ